MSFVPNYYIFCKIITVVSNQTNMFRIHIILKLTLDFFQVKAVLKNIDYDFNDVYYKVAQTHLFKYYFCFQVFS